MIHKSVSEVFCFAPQHFFRKSHKTKKSVQTLDCLFCKHPPQKQNAYQNESIYIREIRNNKREINYFHFKKKSVKRRRNSISAEEKWVNKVETKRTFLYELKRSDISVSHWWVPASFSPGESFPFDAVQGSETLDGLPIYVGRVLGSRNGALIPANIMPTKQKCFIGHEFFKRNTKKFEVWNRILSEWLQNSQVAISRFSSSTQTMKRFGFVSSLQLPELR